MLQRYNFLPIPANFICKNGAAKLVTAPLLSKKRVYEKPLVGLVRFQFKAYFVFAVWHTGSDVTFVVCIAIKMTIPL